MNRVTFLIIGAAKAGTTSLYATLSQNAAVYMPAHKEPQFFAHDDQYARGIAWYEALFGGASSAQLCGEASTHYSLFPRYPLAPQRIAQYNPGMRLVYVVRHPVLRCYSHYLQRIKTAGGFRNRPYVFEEYIDAHSYLLDASDYMLQIARYQEYFGREQMLIVLFDELVASPATELQRILRFIGVDGRDVGTTELARTNVSDRGFEQLCRRAVGRGVYERIPGATRLAQLLPSKFRASVGRKLFRRDWTTAAASIVPRAMEIATWHRLNRRFERSIAELEAFLGRKLPQWHEQSAGPPPRAPRSGLDVPGGLAVDGGQSSDSREPLRRSGLSAT